MDYFAQACFEALPEFGELVASIVQWFEGLKDWWIECLKALNLTHQVSDFIENFS